MKRTSNQNKRFWQLINRLDIDADMRRGLVLEFSGGRTDSSKELSIEEMDALIKSLEGMLSEAEKRERKEREERQQKRRKVFKLFYRLGWIDGGWSNKEKLRVINSWLWRRSGIEKNLNELSVEELNHVIRQLNIVIENYEQDNDKGNNKGGNVGEVLKGKRMYSLVQGYKQYLDNGMIINLN